MNTEFGKNRIRPYFFRPIPRSNIIKLDVQIGLTTKKKKKRKQVIDVYSTKYNIGILTRFFFRNAL